MKNIDTFKQLLEPDFDWSILDLEGLSSMAIEVIELSDVRQMVLGTIALQAYKMGKRKAVNHIATLAEIPQKTLVGYMNTMQRLEGMDVPEDLSWTFRKTIAWTEDPAATLKIVVDEGLTLQDLLRRLGKVKPQQQELIHCPKCHSEMNFHKCQNCGEEIK